jgi:hypothetical protein
LSAFEDIADRAIEYTDLVLHTTPSYREAAVAALRKLRDNLARRASDDGAIRRLDVYLERLSRGGTVS